MLVERLVSVFALFDIPPVGVPAHPAVYSSSFVHRYNHQTRALSILWGLLGETFAMYRLHELDSPEIPVGDECSVWKPFLIPVLRVFEALATLLLIPTVAKPKHIACSYGESCVTSKVYLRQWTGLTYFNHVCCNLQYLVEDTCTFQFCSLVDGDCSSATVQDLRRPLLREFVLYTHTYTKPTPRWVLTLA